MHHIETYQKDTRFKVWVSFPLELVADLDFDTSVGLSSIRINMHDIKLVF